jgi:hypothetical protein
LDQENKKMARRQKPRRGVVLLIILTLLTLLIVVGLTFAILSGQFRRAAETVARQERYGDPEQKWLDRAMYQILRDTQDINSVVRGHGLLTDIYAESVRGQVTGAAVAGGGGQFWDFAAVLALPDVNSNGTVDAADVNHGFRTSGFLNGCVLTFVSGRMRNISTRIVAYTMDITQSPPLARFRILAANRDDLAAGMPTNQDVFVINGRAFSGTGAGYEGDPTAAVANYGRLSREVTIGTESFPHALLPNRVGEPLAQTQANYGQGGLNESYDAADYQNVALAALIPDPANPGRVRVLPSFHQVALINYWQHHNSGMWNPGATSPDATRYRDFRRSVIFRPMPWDHPNFDGGNANFAAMAWTPGLDSAPGVSGVDDDGRGGVDDAGELGWPGSDDVLANDAAVNSALLNGPWDVDCDGDGTPDAMWLDLGMPIQTDASGRRYKPLFAVLCTDMDGKLNVNANGGLSHVAMVAPGTQSVPFPIQLPSNTGFVNSSALPLPKGQGYGPPEVSLMPLFSSVAEYAALLQGNVALGIPGRYGLDQVPGDLGISTLAQLKLLGYPPALPIGSSTNYFLPTTPLSSFNNPFDLRGEFALGLDYRGASLHERSQETNLLLNTPYEIDLSSKAPRGVSATPTPDTPYSLSELERLLRANDVDAYSLPSRLWRIVDTFRNNPDARRGVTTDSYDVPSPSIQPWPELLPEFRSIRMDRPRHITDIIRMKLITARGLTSANLDDPAVIQALNHDLERIMSADMISGTRFDVNRPFGNGVDDASPVTGNPNRVVDDHGVGTGAFRGEDASNTESFWGLVPFDHDNDGVTGNTDNNAFLVRHYYAKHLYILMMAIKPANVEIDFDANPTNNSPRETAYGIAQWAINAVDFRDADSIMTPFEFDIFPFTNPFAKASGWDVDGVVGSPDDDQTINTERGLVWGCERPELLISEAFALHDRRTEDLSVNGKTTDTTNPDPDFDQRLRPRSGFFVELYNPWAGDEGKPGEFYYNHVSGSWSPGVLLNQVTPGPAQFPVWRMVVAKGTNKLRDPDHWDQTERMPVGAIERSIYFTPFAGPVTGVETPYFTNLPVAPILPGRYAVIGSAGQTVDETDAPLDLDSDGIPEYLTPLGRLTAAVEGGGLNYAGTRSIVLEPSLDLTQHQAQVIGNAASTPEPLPPDIQPSVGVVINQPMSLSVTEPVTGYPATGPAGEVWDPALADYEGAYTPTALDSPLDTDPELVQNGTTDDYCVVHLQRLANPLLPYDPILNPYLTIDSMSSDLTSFNGVTADLDSNAGTNEQRMTTRERGDSLTPTEPRALWKHELAVAEGGVPSESSDDEAGNLHILAEVFNHSLGYLNEPYRTDGTLDTYFYDAAAASALAPPTAFPEPPLSNRTRANYIGAPALVPANPLLQNPFPWLNWHNRPFVSQYDLMLVPKTRSSRLPIDYSITPAMGSDYAPNSTGSFGHLLNFFQTSDALPANGSNFYRLFELTHVPSRFMDTETYFNPNLFAGSAVDNTIFHPPFNYFPQFRVPGLINVNTAYDQGIWTGIQAGRNWNDWTWANLVSTRRGYGSSTTNILDLDNDYPTFFANPLRAVGAGALVPSSGGGANWDRLEVETTLLRSNSIPYSASPTKTLFEYESDQPYNNTDRNPYFRYQGIDRLGNLITTRSNVYAVWITVGYFEVEPSPDAHTAAGLATHPDGFRLGKELGSDAGTVKRHRAFYVIDRSQPVAFEPGENHNVDRAVMLRRYIE